MTNAITSTANTDPWTKEMRAALRSAADFVIAQVTDDPAVTEIAGQVICFRDGEFVSVAAIATQCSAHGWNSMIYEAWSWERRNQILSEVKMLVAHERDALLLYAESQESLSVTQADAYDAIEEARRELYGELDDDDDGCDIGDDHEDDLDHVDFA